MSNESNDPGADDEYDTGCEDDDELEIPIDSGAFLTPVLLALTLVCFGVGLVLGLS